MRTGQKERKASFLEKGHIRWITSSCITCAFGLVDRIAHGTNLYDVCWATVDSICGL